MRKILLFVVLLLVALRAQADLLIDESAEREAFTSEVNTLFAAEKYDELDRMADDLRKTHARFPGGLPKLVLFYEGLEGVSSTNYESAMVTRLQQIRKWMTTDTNSVAARVFFGSTYRKYAWRARGGGWASSVSKEGRYDFESRLTTARQVLEEAGKLPTPDPAVYTELITVAQGLKLPRNIMEGYFEKAVAIDPAYSEAYCRKALYLLPQWYGKHGEWTKVAEVASDDTLATDGDSYYARVVWYVAGSTDVRDLSRDDRFFERNEISWPRLKKGFQDMDKRYPHSLRNVSVFCDFACLAGDRQTAWELFQRLGDQIYLTEWKTKSRFYKWRQWADPQTPASAFQPKATLRAIDAFAKTPSLLDKLVGFIVGEQPRTRITSALSILSIALSRDGRWLAAGCSQGVIIVWDLQTREVLTRILAHRGDVTSVAFSPDGRWLASCTGDEWAQMPQGEVRLWDTKSWTQKSVFGKGEGPFYSVAFSPDSQTIAAAGGVAHKSSVTKLWNISTMVGEVVDQFLKNPPRSVAFSPDGNLLAVGGWIKVVIWDCSAGKYWDQFKAPNHSGYVKSVMFSPDGTRLVSASVPGGSSSDAGEIKLWQIVPLESEPISLQGELGRVSSAAFSPDGKMLATGGEDEIARLWDVQTASQTAAFLGHWNEVSSVLFTPDGKTLISGSHDGTVNLWDISHVPRSGTSRPPSTEGN